MKAIATSLSILVVSFSFAYSQALIGIRTGAPAASPDATGGTGQEAATLSVRHLEAARPLLGYVTDSSNVLRPVVGSAASPQWGEPLVLPGSTTATFLPPRQEYILLASKEGLAVARLSRSAIYPGTEIPEAIRRPDRVFFSPSGEAAALFSKTENCIEVLTSMATKVRVRWTVAVANPADELLQLALSDDGDLLVAQFANQLPILSWRGSAWQSLSTSYQPDAWTFLPRSHDLVLNDRTQRAIVILPEAERAPVASRLLVSGDPAGSVGALSANKQGTQLLAVAVGSLDSWSIDLGSGSVASLPAKNTIDSLVLLRDGQSFLVSTTDLPVVIKLSDGATQSSAINISQ